MDRTDGDLTRFELEVISKFLEGDNAALRKLRDQLKFCRVIERDLTGVGFFTKLAVHESASAADLRDETVRLTDVAAEIDGLSHGAGFVLYLHRGRLSSLEGFTYDEPWPQAVGQFVLSYTQFNRPELADLLTAADGAGS